MSVSLFCWEHCPHGDYLIDDEDVQGMATPIRYGTDTFKTWEHILDYFSRLGGQ